MSEYRNEIRRRRGVCRRALELCNAIKSHEVPQPICCVYFLLRFGRLIYVGQTTNLHERVFGHRRNKSFDEVLYMECNAEELSDLETLFIAAFKPKQNYQNTPYKILGWLPFTAGITRRLRRRMFAPSWETLIRRGAEKVRQRDMLSINTFFSNLNKGTA